MIPPPTLIDWELDSPLPWPPKTDEGCAFHHFYGKSLEAAEMRFLKDPYGAKEDFSYMPDICRRYYVVAFANYLLSEKSHDDSDAATCYVSLVDEFATLFSQCDPASKATLMEALSRVESELNWYGVDVESYGGVVVRIANCKANLNSKWIGN